MSKSDDVKRLREQIQKDSFESDKKEAGTAGGKFWYEFSAIRKFLWQVAQVALWIWLNLANPVLSFVIIPGALWFWKYYRVIWEKFTIVKDKYGIDHFSKKRGIIVVLATIFTVWLGINLAFLTLDTTLFIFTNKTDEAVFLFNSNDGSLEKDGQSFSVPGCQIENTKTLSCNDENSLYYRIDDNWFNNVWSLINRHWFFYPEYVGSAIAPGWNRCVVTSYGVRIKLAMRILNLYPELLSTVCSPVVTQAAQ